MFSIDLNERVALVTGGSGGIGSTICTTLAKAGARVAIGYHSNEPGARQTLAACGKENVMIKGDVSRPDECRRIAEETLLRFGRIDILVNNAAINRKEPVRAPFEVWVAHWRETLDANLLSAVHLSHCAIEPMKSRGGGKIINVASRSAFRGETEYAAYAVAKAGMVNLTRCLARIHAGDNIRVYAVAPGFIEAGMGVAEIAVLGDEIRAQIPSGVIGSAQDVANVVLFLASELSDYISGSTIDVNGGSYLH